MTVSIVLAILFVFARTLISHFYRFEVNSRLRLETHILFSKCPNQGFSSPIFNYEVDTLSSTSSKHSIDFLRKRKNTMPIFRIQVLWRAFEVESLELSGSKVRVLLRHVEFGLGCCLDGSGTVLGSEFVIDGHCLRNH